MKSEKYNSNSVSEDGVLLQETCYKITGCAIDILNALGPGLSENIYSECLKIEMDKRNIAYYSDCACPLIYAQRKVGEVSVPFVVEDRLVVACVVSEHFNETDYSRYISCLRALGLPMALLLNFQFGKLQWRKISV
jgi:GxxExxY protein